jgi:hypothetical protein
MNRFGRLALSLALLAIPNAVVLGAGLGGSHTSMRHQHAVAIASHFTFVATQAQLDQFVRENRLSPLANNADLIVSGVSFPYARPAVTLFAERLAAQYHAATGELLVVTSLTRPMDGQPRNASPLSVHPAGMAVDLRIPSNPRSRRWLENTLLALEKKGLLDVTRERSPKHYHIAVFPEKYQAYVAALGGKQVSTSVAPPVAPPVVIAEQAQAPSHVAQPLSDRRSLLPLLAAFGLLGIATATASRRLWRAKAPFR